MMDFGAVATTASLISNVISSAKSARELAKDTDDLKLKEQISDVYDNLLDLKARVLSLDDENRQLKAQLAQKAAYVGPIAPHGYFYKADDGQKMQHPLCPTCFQKQPQEIGYMTEPKPVRGGIRRRCKLCRTPVDEKPVSTQPISRNRSLRLLREL